ncbi:MAG: hypothetical protein WDA60_11705 [Acidimicrobiia bacterium]
MTDRVELALRAIRATLEGDSTVVEDLFTHDVRASMSTTVWSAPGLAVEIEDRAGAFADVSLIPNQWRTLDDEIWVEWSASVVHVGPFAIEGVVIEPTGRRTELTGITVAEFTGDRIAGFRQYWDCAALMDDHASRRPHRGRRQRG